MIYTLINGGNGDKWQGGDLVAAGCRPATTGIGMQILGHFHAIRPVTFPTKEVWVKLEPDDIKDDGDLWRDDGEWKPVIGIGGRVRKETVIRKLTIPDPEKFAELQAHVCALSDALSANPEFHLTVVGNLKNNSDFLRLIAVTLQTYVPYCLLDSSKVHKAVEAILQRMHDAEKALSDERENGRQLVQLERELWQKDVNDLKAKLAQYEPAWIEFQGDGRPGTQGMQAFASRSEEWYALPNSIIGVQTQPRCKYRIPAPSLADQLAEAKAKIESDGEKLVALDKIRDELEARIAELKSLNGWIKTSDRLPTEADADNVGDVYVHYSDNTFGFRRWFNGVDFITHFLPLSFPAPEQTPAEKRAEEIIKEQDLNESDKALLVRLIEKGVIL